MSVVLLYITVCQLYCCTLLYVSCTAVHSVYFPIVQISLGSFPKKLIRPVLASSCLSVCPQVSQWRWLAGKFSSWTYQEIPWLILNVSFHHSVQYSCHLSICCVRSVHPTQSRLTSLCSSALVFFHISFVPPVVYFFWPNFVKAFLYICSLPYVQIASPIQFISQMYSVEQYISRCSPLCNFANLPLPPPSQ